MFENISKKEKCDHEANHKDEQLDLNVHIGQNKMGLYKARIPGIPGCHAEGETAKQALENLEEECEQTLDLLAWTNLKGKYALVLENLNEKSDQDLEFLGITFKGGTPTHDEEVERQRDFLHQLKNRSAPQPLESGGYYGPEPELPPPKKAKK
jgi:predicted RNase H-like HicB family nuclease